MAVPTDFSGLVTWLKADSLGLADGTAVATWTDSSGAGNNATATGTAQPTYKTAILNSLAVVRFNGTSTVLALPNAVTAQSTIVIVYTGATGTGSMISGLNSSGAWLQRNTSVWVNANQPAISLKSGINTGNVYCQTFDYTRNAYNAYVGGSRVGQTNAAYTSLATGAITLEIGARNGVSEFFTGDIAEVIIYSRVLTVDELNQVNAYIAGKYALTIANSYPFTTGLALMGVG